MAYVKIEILYKDGFVILVSTLPLEISFSGQSAVIASENGNAEDMESFRSLQPKAFQGRAIVLVQSCDEKGAINLVIAAGGLPQEALAIETN